MTDAELIELGGYCEHTLSAPQFNTIVQLFEATTAKEILSTALDAKEQREALYHHFNGLKAFLSHMLTLAQASNLAQAEQKSIEEKSITNSDEELPDDVVFDIFRQEDEPGDNS